MSARPLPGARKAISNGKSRGLFGPMADFLLLGGGSFFILPLFALIPTLYEPAVIRAAFLLSFAVNYPHFANSYQIFYRGFGRKLRGVGYPGHMRRRYAFAGLIVPCLLIAAFAGAVLSESKLALGLCASAMAFFVGWHYVKQGYGILIVDSVFQKQYFNDAEKRLLRINAYACWMFFFLLSAYQLHEKNFVGLRYYLPEVPLPFLYIALAGAAATTIAAVRAALQAKARSPEGSLPIAGYAAYAASLYIWLCVLFSPAVIAIIPAFHSLQYLAVVWRYQINREKAELASEGGAADASRLLVRLATFLAVSVLLGTLAFWTIPSFLDSTIAYDKAMYGESLFLFMFWIFINIHHYFLDNVMWRKDNPDVRAHLFAAS